MGLEKNTATLFTAALFVALFSGLIAKAAEPGKLEILATHRQTFTPAEGSPDSALSLLNFDLVIMTKKLTLDDGPQYAHFMTDSRAVVSVKNSMDFESYSVVQYIRGCQFESEYLAGQIKKNLSIKRIHFGQAVVFRHPTWTIDTDNSDPVYSSDGEKRFALYRWNDDPSDLSMSNAHWYAKEKPSGNTVFVSDLPGTAYYYPPAQSSATNGLVAADPTAGEIKAREKAKNASLEFRTCLYRTSDLPLKSDPSGAGMPTGKEIACLNWEHKFVYDFTRHSFVAGGPIDPVCL